MTISIAANPATTASTPVQQASNALSQAQQKWTMAQDYWVKDAAPKLVAFNTGVGNFMAQAWTKLTPLYDQLASFLQNLFANLFHHSSAPAASTTPTTG